MSDSVIQLLANLVAVTANSKEEVATGGGYKNFLKRDKCYSQLISNQGNENASYRQMDEGHHSKSLKIDKHLENYKIHS